MPNGPIYDLSGLGSAEQMSGFDVGEDRLEVCRASAARLPRLGEVVPEPLQSQSEARIPHWWPRGTRVLLEYLPTF